MYENKNQNNLDWFRARLGNITGSAVGNIMGTPRSKTEEWTTTAQSYLNQVAFERSMNPLIVHNDDLFRAYIELTEAKSKAIDWGHAMEGEAAHLFAKTFCTMFGKSGENFELQLEEPSSVKCEGLSHFASSPDRMFYDNETGEMCCIEIKCPQGAAFAKYVKNIFTKSTNAERIEGLKKVEANYYWQCFAHMLATGASKTYFVVYNPFQLHPLNAAEIERDEAVISTLKERIIKANEYIEKLSLTLAKGQTKIA